MSFIYKSFLVLICLTNWTVYAATTDADILATLRAADHAEEISSAVLDKKNTNPQVEAFAKKMIQAHGAVDKKLETVATKLGLKPTENMESRKIEMKAALIKKELQLLSGSKLNKQYMEDQVAMHLGVLDTIDNKLAPAAQHPEVRDLLRDVRAAVITHIKSAQGTLKTL